MSSTRTEISCGTKGRIHQVLDCSPTNRERELGLDRRETVREEPLIRTIGHRAWLKSQWREATVRWIMTEVAIGFPATTRKRSFCGRWLQLAFAVAGGCGRLTSHKSPANAPIFNRSTSRTNLLKPLETATARIHKLPQPQPQPLRLNQSGPERL
ncbi:hypothetical protein YC2023_003752 [Brassica napus]